MSWRPGRGAHHRSTGLRTIPTWGALKGDLRGLRRLRVGEYRVVYEVPDEVLEILAVRISHRRNASR